MASAVESKSYYSILGITNNASTYAIRNAYRKLVMKWHPDKCSCRDKAGAKLKFQEIQEAYSVLSDARKKALYDIDLYDPDDDDEDVEGLDNFIIEMSEMMAEVQTSKDDKGSSFKELQQLFLDMFSADLSATAFNDLSPLPPPSMQFDRKRNWSGHQGTSLGDHFGTCIVDGKINPHDSHIFVTQTFDDSNVTKKKKSTMQGNGAFGVAM